MPDQCVTITHPPMTHKALMQAIVEMAGWLGWRCYFTWRSIHSPAGYLDLTCVNVAQQRVIWLEVKVGRDRVSSAQQEWFDDLTAAGCEAYIMRETDWHVGRIEAILRRKPEREDLP